jgi:hypothetical protein
MGEVRGRRRTNSTGWEVEGYFSLHAGAICGCEVEGDEKEEVEKHKHDGEVQIDGEGKKDRIEIHTHKPAYTYISQFSNMFASRYSLAQNLIITHGTHAHPPAPSWHTSPAQQSHTTQTAPCVCATTNQFATYHSTAYYPYVIVGGVIFLPN